MTMIKLLLRLKVNLMCKNNKHSKKVGLKSDKIEVFPLSGDTCKGKPENLELYHVHSCSCKRYIQYTPLNVKYYTKTDLLEHVIL